MKRRPNGRRDRRTPKKPRGKEIENLSSSSSLGMDSEDYIPSSSDFSWDEDSVGFSYGPERRKVVRRGTGRDSLEVDSDDLGGGSATPARRKKRNWKRQQKKHKGNSSNPLDGSDGEEAAPPEIIDLDELRPEPRGVRRRGSGRRERKRRERGDAPLIWEVLEDENEKWIDEHGNDTVNLDGKECALQETAEPPPDLIMPLLRFQKEWLAWALKQEESPIKGGILADEMGMGKTIQAISLVLAARPFRSTYHEFPSPSSSSVAPALPKIKGTLVLCPLVAVVQWVNEIRRFTATGSVSIHIYHGAKRIKAIQELSMYDFVLTTYSTVEAEYRKNNMPPKERCQWCGKLLYPRKMTIHLKYFCGPNAVKTEKQSKQSKKKQGETGSKKKLKVVQEKEEDEDAVGYLKSVNRKGDVRAKKRGKSTNENMIGSYNDELRGEESLPGKSILHSVKWERIILDEAHYIKDRRCNTARAVLSLQSFYKWALSGTPLQNRVGELYSLVRFLQITPYSYYYCKDCDCKCLDYSSTVDCPNCVHKASRHFCWWNRYIAKPIQQSGYVNDGRRAMILLRNKILKSVVLRRTKKGRAADLALPPRFVSLRRDTLDKKEEDFYEALYTQSQAQFNTYVEAGTLMNNYAHIFDLLTRLRQAVDHPYLVIYSQSAQQSGSKIDNAEQQQCGICCNPSEDPVVTSCEHVFCKACLLDYSTSLGQVSCPSCARLLTADFTTARNPDDRTCSTSVKGFRHSSILNKINLEDFQTSTKIEALREEIRRMVEYDGSAKAIVFSQFTSYLDLINYSLQKSGINCVQLVGSMSMGAREDAIKKFSDDPRCRIFLMSLKAGGVALNLTVASYVFLMDPWWNPAVECQAQDRIHRIGQYKPIRIVRFVIENTIEERILRLQEKKELVFEGTVGGSSEALGRLTESDLKFLFNS